MIRDVESGNPRKRWINTRDTPRAGKQVRDRLQSRAIFPHVFHALPIFAHATCNKWKLRAGKRVSRLATLSIDLVTITVKYAIIFDIYNSVSHRFARAAHSRGTKETKMSPIQGRTMTTVRFARYRSTGESRRSSTLECFLRVRYLLYNALRSRGTPSGTLDISSCTRLTFAPARFRGKPGRCHYAARTRRLANSGKFGVYFKSLAVARPDPSNFRTRCHTDISVSRGGNAPIKSPRGSPGIRFDTADVYSRLCGHFSTTKNANHGAIGSSEQARRRHLGN